MANQHESQTTNTGDDQSVLELLQKIKNGVLEPKVLAPDTRQRIVMHLTGEGWSTAEMARLLHIADRTIIRDRKAIQRELAPQRDDAEVDRMAGRIMLEMDTAITRVRRAARDANASPADRIEAERAVLDALQRGTQMLQGLGYMPKAAHHMTADVTHHAGEAPTFDELGQELEQLKHLKLGKKGKQELKQIEAQLERGRAAEQIATQKQKVKQDKAERDDE